MTQMPSPGSRFLQHVILPVALGVVALAFGLTEAAPEAQSRPPAPQVQGGPIADIQGRTQQLEHKVETVETAIEALTVEVGRLSAAQQVLIDQLSQQLSGIQNMLDSLNTGLNTTVTSLTALVDRVAAAEARLNESGGGLSSYDQLAGLPCTTAVGTPGTIFLVTGFQLPVCAVDMISPTLFDFGIAFYDASREIVWEKKDTNGGLHDVANVFSHCEAAISHQFGCSPPAGPTWIEQLNASGYGGRQWGIPSRDQLLGLSVLMELNAVCAERHDGCLLPVFGRRWTESDLQQLNDDKAYWTNTPNSFGNDPGKLFAVTIFNQAFLTPVSQKRHVRAGSLLKRWWPL